MKRGPRVNLNVNLEPWTAPHMAHLPWTVRLSLTTAAMERHSPVRFVAIGFVLSWVIMLASDWFLVARIGDAAPLLAVVCTFSSWGVLAVMARRARLRMLGRVMYDRGYRPLLCCRCDYNLKGSTADTCPECGEPLAPPSDREPVADET